MELYPAMLQKFSDIIRYKSTWLLFLVLFSGRLFPGEKSKFEWQTSEEYTYKIKWSVVRLGTVKLIMSDSFNKNGHRFYKVKFIADSNPFLFLIDLHNNYETLLDDIFRPHYCIANERSRDEISFSMSRFDYNSGYRELSKKSDSTGDSLRIEKLLISEQLYDGLALIYYARNFVDTTRSDTLTSFFEETTGNIILNFTGRTERLKTDWTENEVECYYLDGRINIEGIAGVTGPYRGWFTADEKRIPVRAELKVFVGNVIAELER